MSRANPGRWAAAGLAAALAACGALDSPDLTTGQVTGQVAGVTAPGGYVYVLGVPDRKASLAPDGSYRLERAPAGNIELVVVAPSGGTTRAEIVPVTVAGGMVAHLDRDASVAPVAGRIVAALRPVGGGMGTAAKFTVDRTIHQGVVGSGVVLGDLPAGTVALPRAWTLEVSLAGYRPRSAPVAVIEGADTTWDGTVDIDDTDAHRGCLSATCESPLVCNAADGQCYACVSDAQCGASEHCDNAAGGTWTCVQDSGLGGYCSSSDSKDKCTGGQLVSTGGSYGYCSSSCSAGSDCPAGWACSGTPGVCTVLQSCRQNAETFGASCAHNSACVEISGGICLRFSDDEAGICTAPCADASGQPSDQRCIDAGFGTCKALKNGVHLCQR